MAYEKQTWQTGDVVTSAKLNHMEDGIAAGGALIVHDVNGTLDKTWQEIHDAAPLVTIVINGDEITIAPVFKIGEDGVFLVVAGILSQNGIQPSIYAATSADGYPALDS